MRMTDTMIIAEAAFACPCGETGHPAEQCNPDYIAELGVAIGRQVEGETWSVPDVASGSLLCLACRRLVVHGVGPHSDFARRCNEVLAKFPPTREYTAANPDMARIANLFPLDDVDFLYRGDRKEYCIQVANVHDELRFYLAGINGVDLWISAQNCVKDIVSLLDNAVAIHADLAQ